jgi:hypothetical protein
MEFDVLVAKGPGGAWTFLPIPFNVQEVFGTAGRLAAAGTVNGFPFRNSLMPEGDGSHSMIFNKELQAGACAKAGDRVKVVLERDQGERQIATSAELERVLRANEKATVLFAELTFSQKKEYADWISSAKQQATKEKSGRQGC